MRSKILFNLLIIGVILCSIGFVSAEFGVGSPKNVLILPDQPTKDTALALQNTLDDSGDMIIKGSILKGAEYVSFIGDVSAIEVLKGKVVQVPIRVNVPGAKPGEKYEVTFLFETISDTSSGGGMIEFKYNVEKSVQIVVYEEPGEEAQGISTIWIILGIVLIVIVISLIWFAVKNKKPVVVVKK